MHEMHADIFLSVFLQDFKIAHTKIACNKYMLKIV